MCHVVSDVLLTSRVDAARRQKRDHTLRTGVCQEVRPGCRAVSAARSLHSPVTGEIVPDPAWCPVQRWCDGPQQAAAVMAAPGRDLDAEVGVDVEDDPPFQRQKAPTRRLPSLGMTSRPSPWPPQRQRRAPPPVSRPDGLPKWWRRQM
jgi:hypothetical protein